VKVAGANVEHGLLTIDLLREVPEELKPRRIQIRSGAEAQGSKKDNQQKQINVGAKTAA
jgi:molecular chaperone IbpA